MRILLNRGSVPNIITVILAGLKKIFCYTEDFVKYRGLLNQGSTV